MKRSRKITIGTAVVIAAALSLVLISRSLSTTDNADTASEDPAVALSIGDRQISEEEFQYGLDSVRSSVASEVSAPGSSVGKEIWEATGPESAARLAAERASEVIHRRYALYTVLADGGVVSSPQWDELKERFIHVNKQREADKAAGEVVYGLTTFDLPTFITYESGTLTEAYVHNENIPAMVVSEADVQQHYDDGEWVIGREEEAHEATLEEVRSNVVADLRRQRFAQLVDEAADELAVDADFDQLAIFASQYYTR